MHTVLLSACLLAHIIPGLLRGPYLQSATSTSIIIRWRTNEPTDSRVLFGESPATLFQSVDSTSSVTEHEVKLTGLQPKKRYYYSIGSAQGVLQGDAGNFFETAPLPAQTGKYTIGVMGDCGNNSVNQINTRDKLLDFLGNEYMDAWLLLGDNAYMTGTEAEYQSGFFNIYKDRLLKQTPLYPTPGNHDYANNASRQVDHAVPYYNIFTVPSAGEAGGVPSGTESFYSFDYGNTHFLSLDSYGMESGNTRLYDTLGTQVQWVKADLAANTNKDWVIAYWHHPPYTKGSHDSDIELELINMRKNFIRILERNGVDLILCGHSHDYERSKLMHGHYGLENSFNPAIYNLSQSSGRYDGSSESCPYIKKSSDNEGTVYVVAGSAGQLGATKAGYPHNALPFANASYGGAVLLQVEGNRLDAKWIASDGIVRDQFTIVKDVNKKTSVEIEKGESITIASSYIGSYLWSTGDTSREVTVSPAVTTEYVVKDEYSCLSDTTEVIVTNPLPVKLSHFSGSFHDGRVTLEWETTEEINAGYFLVERSQDGRTFEPIGKVDALGDSRKVNAYHYDDENVNDNFYNSNIYYRLKEVDRDGKTQYSRIVSIKLDSYANDKIRIKPNPSSGEEIWVEIGKGIGKCKLILSNVNGQTLREMSSNAETIAQSYPLGKLNAGTYIIKAVFGSEIISRKFVVR
ncbi:metallophosphoesterase [Dyadobacter fermentans]|uniref:Metallophosphoesterase n=1 Tax=Dyadobacter fermentans (strain ATCC 700827 / DSM 18053 / CIP 107007 / KCTC 52180 / NS114) TaxID=471854 RepID=C6VXE6_DYAFD|nr:metallophosphoesterase [Dyadobacter fermentans]ACT93289.1 metallophosphoesterase [Dyadobacter fermentans DSM 18053]